MLKSVARWVQTVYLDEINTTLFTYDDDDDDDVDDDGGGDDDSDDDEEDDDDHDIKYWFIVS